MNLPNDILELWKCLHCLFSWISMFTKGTQRYLVTDDGTTETPPHAYQVHGSVTFLYWQKKQNRSIKNNILTHWSIIAT